MFILKGFWNGSSCQSLLNQSGPRQQRPFRHSTVPSFGVGGDRPGLLFCSHFPPADGNLLQISDPSVSGRHCEVRLTGEELIVRDLQSTNGTFVDGKNIIEAT